MKNKREIKNVKAIQIRNSLNISKNIESRNNNLQIPTSKSEIPIKKKSQIKNKEPKTKKLKNKITNISSLKTISTEKTENLNQTKLSRNLSIKSENETQIKIFRNHSQKSQNEKNENLSRKQSNIIETENIKEQNKESINLKSEKPEKERNKNIRVYIRFRPLNIIEQELLSSNIGFETPEYLKNEIVKIKNNKNENENYNSQLYKFDKVFKNDTTQKKIYEIVGKEIVKDVMEGYNGTIFAYGQSGSGKTYTMYGKDIQDNENKGLIPRIVEDIFNYVENADQNISFQLKLSVLQIYKEIIYDLLTGEKNLHIKENPTRGIYVEGLSEVYLSSEEDFLNYAIIAESNRKVGETKLNQTSSRSHSIMIIEIIQILKKENLIKKGILNLVDLAGSEKVSKTGAIGETLEEAKKINLSLSSLGNVIHALTSKSDHIPYRDSKLTRILKESLGGNYKTSLIVSCSPHSYNIEETISSLQFAQRVKTIKNKVKVNIKYSYEQLQQMVYKLNKKLEEANLKILKMKNGELFDEDDNEFCGLCNLVKEEKKVLEDKVEELLNEIKEKNEVIEKLKNKDNLFVDNSDEIKEDILKLYKKIKIELENIKEQKSNFEFDKISENIILQNEYFNDILMKYSKEFNKDNLFNEMNLLIKNTLKLKKEEKYDSIFNEYKNNMDKIFKEQIENKKIKNISENSQLKIFTINYFYDYLQYYFSYQLLNKGYEKLKIDNKTLINMTKSLLNIIDDILSTNYEMITTNNIQTNTLNYIKNTMIENPNPNSRNSPKKLTPRNMGMSISIGGTFNQGIVKVVNKTNLNIKKNNNNNIKTILPIPIQKFNIGNTMRSSLISDNNFSFVSERSETNEKNQRLFLKTERKQSKLTMIKDLLVANVKKSEILRNEFFDLKKDFNQIIQFNKEYFTQIILKNEIKEDEKNEIGFKNKKYELTNDISKYVSENNNSNILPNELSKIEVNKIENKEIPESLIRNYQYSLLSCKSEDKDKTKLTIERDLNEESNYNNKNFDLAMSAIRTIYNKTDFNSIKNSTKNTNPTNLNPNLFEKNEDITNSKSLKRKNKNIIYNNNNEYEEDKKNLTPTNSNIKKNVFENININNSFLFNNNPKTQIPKLKKTKQKIKKKGIKTEYNNISHFNFNKNSIKFEQNCNFSLEIKPNNSYRIKDKCYTLNINQKNDLNNNLNSLEGCIEKYLETGTVTRKFDGINVNFTNGKLKCEYAGGLNATHKITINPLSNQRLKASQGDDDSVNENSIFRTSH